MLSGWGILISFWSVLVFSSAFFRRFFRGTVCLGSFVFPGAFLAFFSRKNWRLFAVTLLVTQLACVGPFVHGFSSFSVCLLRVLRSTTGRRTCFRLLRRRLFLFSRFLWPFFSSCFGPHDFAFGRNCSHSGPHSSSISPAQLSLLRFVQRSSLPVFQRGSSPGSSVVFPALFLAFVSSSALDVASLFFFSCRYLEIAAFLCLPSLLFLSSQALARPVLARWFEAPIIASYVFPAFLYTAKVWSESCNRRIQLFQKRLLL